MDETTQESVSTETSSLEGTSASSDVAASLSSTEDTSQTATASDVTAQSVIEATGTGTGTVDPAQEADPLEGVPTLEELEQNKTQQYAQALINLRTAYEARKGEVETLKPLEALKDITQYGDADTIKSRLDAYNSLFEQAVDPATQQPQFDESGLPKVSAAKFIEQVDAENPGLAEQMLNDLLRYAPELPNGQKVSFYERALREVYGLDPKRLDDYRKIDALTAPTGEVTPEELAAIPENQRDAYKTLPKSLRDAWEQIPEDERKFHLDGAQERLEARQYREAETKRQAEVQQQQLNAARQQIVEAQDTYVRQELQTGLATIMDDVAKQVTFSADPNTNAVMLGVTEGFVAALRDPDSSAFKNVQGALNALGVKLDNGFQEALSVADKHMRDQKAYELMGQKGLARNSQDKAHAAKTQVIAKLAPLAVKLAKALGGQAAQRANQQNQLLGAATNTRPTPDSGNGLQAEDNGYLPAGMLANDPRAGIEIAKRIGLLGGS